MRFRIRGLDPAPFVALFGLSDEELARQRVERVRIEKPYAAPCRVSLDDVAPGETALLLSYQHQGADTPYRQAGPIFVAQGAGAPFDDENIIPPALRRRVLSLRGYDTRGAMIEADLVDGSEAEELIAQMFANPQVAAIHAHYARRGCFAARIDRA